MFRNLEQYLFYIFLFSIPFQTRKIFWYSDWKFNEWQSISVYGTDILLVVLFAFWFFNKRTEFKWPKFEIYEYCLFAFLVISGISIKNSSDQIISIFQFIKLVEFIIFYLYLKNYAFQRFDWIHSIWAIIAGGVFQAVVGIGQFLSQSSLGFWYLGESIINVNVKGTAYFLNEAGDKIVRAYGTTPHPNILAGYLLFVLCVVYYVLCIKSEKKPAYYLPLTIYCMILFAFFLTFSRVVILAWAVAFLAGILIYKKIYPRQVKKIFLVTLFVGGLFMILHWPEIIGRMTIPSDDEGLMLRKYYNGESLKSGLNFFGIGIGNFVNWFADRNPYLSHWLYQPVHNIYLLIYSETGLLGISTFVLFLFFSFKKLWLKIYLSKTEAYRLLILFCFLFIGLFDHYLWTLQQGRFLFWLIIAALAAEENEDAL